MLPTDMQCSLLIESAQHCYILLKQTILAILRSSIFTYFCEIWEKASLAKCENLRRLVAMFKKMLQEGAVCTCMVYLQFFMDDLT